MKTISLFAGVGGIDLAFEQAGFDIILANEIDKYASITYSSNLKSKMIVDDIKKIDPLLLPDFDCLVAGFPCQAFSIAGYQKGFKDERGALFFDIVKILQIKKPPIIFLENVKNLLTHNKGQTIQVIFNSLEKIGYHIHYKVLNASKFGNSPQNRERIYIVGFLDQKQYDIFKWPNEVVLTKRISDIIDFTAKVDNKFYYTENKYPSIYEEFNKIPQTRNIYQWRRHYIRENKSCVCPTLTANMGTGGHNVPLVFTDFGLRKLTPKECFLFQGFPKDFVLPNIPLSQLYKQAGNSVCVSVVAAIAKQIKTACSI